MGWKSFSNGNDYARCDIHRNILYVSSKLNENVVTNISFNGVTS